ncbi:MAG: ferredoxin [Gaiellaceae bacterium]
MTNAALTLRVDPIACDGRGLCAELFPERVTLDDWGFPLIDPTPIPRSLEGHARAAVSECPKCALRLVAAGRQRAAAVDSRTTSRVESSMRSASVRWP